MLWRQLIGKNLMISPLAFYFNLTSLKHLLSQIYGKVVDLIKDIQRDPFSGLGKPEALKYDLSGLWSRRITKEHRLVYSVADEEIVIVSCKFHY